MERVGAIVPAAGQGTRMEGIDKLFAPLGRKPLLAWCVEALEASGAVTEIAIAVPPEQMAAVEQLLHERNWCKSRLVPGGTRRQDSVLSALETLSNAGWIIVHDGVRPFLTETLIRRGLSAARETGVAVASVAVKDTVKLMSEEGVVCTLDRDRLRAAQTPQVFRSDILRHAYSCAEETVTDDAMLAERLGYDVRLYEGSYENLKITTRDDLVVAESIASRWEAHP